MAEVWQIQVPFRPKFAGKVLGFLTATQNPSHISATHPFVHDTLI